MTMSTVLTFRVDERIKDELESLAEATHRSKSFLASEALKDYLAREAWQVAHIKQGMRQAEEGLTVPHEEVDAWMASLGTANKLPRPKPKRRASR
jgi:RHH-type transcriptional regulator, rel operon repressor / antitoxin RelB